MNLRGKRAVILSQRDRDDTVLPPPVITAPTGFITDTTPNITWDVVAGAVDYTVQILNGVGTVVYENPTAVSPDGVSPALDPFDGPFTARVRANPNGVWGTATFEYTYTAAILSLGPLIFLGPLHETSGTTAIDDSGNSNDGTYRNVAMLNKTTFLTAEPAPEWVPANNDYLNMSADFLTDFNLDEYCVLIWARARNVGVWSDGQVRGFLYFNRSFGDRTEIRKLAASPPSSTLQFTHAAGGTTDTISEVFSSTDWFLIGSKASRSAGASGEYKAFINGAQVGATQTTLGTATGALTRAHFGALNDTGASVWDGFEAYAMVWSGAGNLPTDAEIASIYSFLVP